MEARSATASSVRVESAQAHSAALARRARLGDRAAFDELYRLHARTVHAVLATRCSAHDAEDRVQDVFLKAWAARGELREPERVAAWLVAIARRESIDELRTRQRIAPLTEDIGDPRAASGAHASARDEGAIVLEELRELPDAYRETLSLRLLGELSGQAIAELVGLTHGSVRVNLHKGMELLRERLKRRGIE